jgi:hypothetical protein
MLAYVSPAKTRTELTNAFVTTNRNRVAANGASRTMRTKALLMPNVLKVHITGSGPSSSGTAGRFP